jgi:hypothetical protein
MSSARSLQKDIRCPPFDALTANHNSPPLQPTFNLTACPALHRLLHQLLETEFVPPRAGVTMVQYGKVTHSPKEGRGGGQPPRGPPQNPSPTHAGNPLPCRP